MKEFSSEQRTLLALLLSMAVLLVWSWIYKPPPPKPSPAPTAAAPVHGEPATKPAAPEAAVAPVSVFSPRAASQEKTITVENDLYRVEFSNRGAVVRSWQLKKYTDDAKPPRTLDLVHPPGPASGTQGDEWPLSLLLQDAQLQIEANSALYELAPSIPRSGTPGTSPTASFRAPAELNFAWSDGHLAVSKRLKFSHDFLVGLETSVELDGRPLSHAVAWRGGFGDATVYQPVEQVTVFYRAGGKLETLPYKKLGASGHPEQPLRQPAAVDYAGIEDHYFAAAFLPQGSPFDFWHWQTERQTVEEGKVAKEPVAEVAAGSASAAPLALRIYVGPKSLAELGRLNPPLDDLVQFGWFWFLSKPLFEILKWIHNYVPNYGWAIVVLTLLINMALFPLKVKSWRSMQKMQKVMPEVKAIQNKYSKYSMRDPRKQEMNKEMMAVYQREGINPMGGCLPMALQMPIWIALYRMLGVAIELRHASWFGWIRDLSAHDPYYVLPVLMVVTMFLMNRMVPATTADPTQQKMMTFMPLFLGVLFFRVSSGLVVYILTSNLVGIGQQWYLNRSAPALAPAGRKKSK